MAIMSREAILAASDIGYEVIDLSDIPGWDQVRIKDLSALERDRLEMSLVAEKTRRVNGKIQTVRELSMDNVRATFCAACIVGEDGSPLFTPADITALGSKSARALDRIFDRIRDRNGIGDGDVEELAKN